MPGYGLTPPLQIKTRTMLNNDSISRSGLHEAHRYRFSLTFLILTVTFCVCLIVANLMEIKTVSIGSLTLTAGVAVFPLSYIIGDCLVEIYGFRKAAVVILLGFAMNLLTVLFLQLGLALPGGPQWEGQEALQTVFGATPRILAASFTAFLAGSFTNAAVMSRMKRIHHEGRFSLRAILSTLLGEGADSAIFFPMAFAGVLPAEVIVSLIVTQTFIKTAYEIVILPLTLLVVRRLRHIEAEVSPLTAVA